MAMATPITRYRTWRVGALDRGDADDVGAGNRQDALCAAGEAAGPVGADRESDDLTEPEGTIAIVTSHPDHRRTNEEPGDDRHEHHDEDRHPPWQLGQRPELGDVMMAAYPPTAKNAT